MRMRPSSVRYGLVLLALLCGVSSRVAAQQDAVLIGKSSGFRGYIELGNAAGPLNGGTGVLPSAFAELILGRYFTIGFGCVGLANKLALPRALSPRGDFIDFEYGGLTLGARIAPSRVVHVTGRVLIAVGGLSLREREEPITPGAPRTPVSATRDDRVMVIEPEAGLEVNLTHWMRLGVTGSYRITRYTDAAFLASDRNLSGGSGRVSLRFGRF